ncbi:MAG: Vi polysaccharide biosynthesis protein VipA/TviB [Spirochaetales bacterium]|jgi:UDP-N-acetyl-D-galactosamine dehydrogenase|nr:Vi polysaccharide biosynthesis protein VipA/TviB [Spirochaetales bacterium]|tara:strand:+ start:2615 stop:3883 length:1269 start_codon:yes stop_codon:yes gene_type:complete
MKKIAIIGLGYIGLPLAASFSKHYTVIGYDKNLSRVKQLNNLDDKTNEYSKKQLLKLSENKLLITNNEKKLVECEIFIIAVPTPVNKNKKPDLSLLIQATKLVSKYILKNSIIIYESTVYPGTTENVCVPIIEKISKKKLNEDFYVGYSPERINPGDKKNTIENVVKLTSASNKFALNIIDKLYNKIVKVGTYKVDKIEEAEAAKVIENVQRDVNIALINELSKLFSKLNIDSNKVLKAASSKWNFLNFKPGLVGGHCIGVDPYYLTHVAKKNNFNPKIILSGRSINDSMPKYVSDKILKTLKINKFKTNNAKILIMGVTFKENCLDIRNSKVFDIYKNLKKNIKIIDVTDPYADSKEVFINYKIKIKKKIKKNYYDLILIAVKHNEFKKINIKEISKYLNNNGILIDLLNLFPSYDKYWKL